MIMAIRMRRTFSWLIIGWWWWWQWWWQGNNVDGADYWKECICGSATQWVFWKEHTRAGNSMRWHFAEEKIMERLRNGFFFNFLKKAWWVGCVKTTWCGLLKVQLARRSEDQVGQLGSHVEFAQKISSFASTEDWELANFYFQRPGQDLKFNLW